MVHIRSLSMILEKLLTTYTTEINTTTFTIENQGKFTETRHKLLCGLGCWVQIIKEFHFCDISIEAIADTRDLIRKVHDPKPAPQFPEFILVFHKHQVDGLPGKELDPLEIDHQFVLHPFSGLFNPVDEFLSRLQVKGALQANEEGFQPLITGYMDIQGFGNSSYCSLTFFEGQMVKRGNQGLSLPYGERGIQLIDNSGSHREAGFWLASGNLPEGQIGCHSGEEPLLGMDQSFDD